jgi:hypothetical protein
MAAVEILEAPAFPEISRGPALRLVSYDPAPAVIRRGASLRQRRLERARVLQRRRRVAVALVLVGALTILALPGHTFGATSGAGLSTDLAGSSTLASGMDYVVQPGNTVNSLAREMNPTNPSVARSLLVHELGSTVVVPGEHVLIP